MISEAESQQITQEIFDLKIEACPGLYIAFWHGFSFATVLAANFGCDWFRIMPEIVSRNCL